MFCDDKKYTVSAKKYHYTSDYKNYNEWCQNCVHFGERCDNPYWLCSESFPEIAHVSYCGHCDKFSDNKKIGLLKYWLLKMGGFKFKSITR